MQQNALEQGRSTAPLESPPPSLVVAQPQKLEGILEAISTLRVSERSGEDRSGDMGAAGGSTSGEQADQRTWRNQALAHLPEPSAMRTELRRHIQDEVKHLQRDIRKAARRVTKPGKAHHLSELYARLRRLNGLLSELAELAYDVLRRLFIRVVIDKQKVL